MKQVILRKNKLFIIDQQKLKPAARTPHVINTLYADIYSEFTGASSNPNYEHLTNLEKLSKVNEFAYAWLKKRGYI